MESASLPVPVTRLTPKFHNMIIENVTAKNSGSDGYTIRPPESPVLDMTLKNVDLEGHTGFSIAYALVTLQNFSANAETGENLTIAPTAHFTKK